MLILLMQVHLINDMRDRCTSSLLNSTEFLASVHALLRTLVALRNSGQTTDGKPHGCKGIFSEVGS
jgi:ataxia telangiectasia mutated family protein